MPVPFRNPVTLACPWYGPVGAGHFIQVPVIAIFKNEIDPATGISVVIIVGLPDVPVRIDRYFIIIPEIMAQYLEMRSVRIATEDHSSMVGISVGDNRVFELSLVAGIR